MDYLLGIDNGGTATKAAIFDLRGNMLASESRNIKIIDSGSGWSERNMESMWRDTCLVIREALSAAQISPDAIICIACTGHGNGLYLIDSKGHPVRHAINSMDQRAGSIVESWRADGLEERVLPLTAQSLWAAQPNALLAWLKENEPQTIELAAFLLMAKDYIRYKLTGEVAMEETDMSATSLMNVPEGKYDDRLLTRYGITELKRLLPPLIKSTSLSGSVTPEAAAATGLRTGTPVAGGMFDIDACGLASGCIDERQLVVVSGTWGNNQYIARQPVIHHNLFMTSRYCIPGWFLMLDGSPTGAGNLNWFLREFLREKQTLLKQSEGEAIFPWIDQTVAGKTPHPDDPLFLPFLYGSNLGHPAQACLLGMKGYHTRADILHAIYEGCIFTHKHHLQRLYAFRKPPESIRLTGGAARSNVWSQMFADILHVPIEIPAGRELGALGAAIAAAVACGAYANYEEAVKQMTRIERTHQPDSALNDLYEERYVRYTNACSCLKPFFTA
ncbi:MAG: FGGY-family carbohydrate kinase [Kiritimatiellia bacterium]